MITDLLLCVACFLFGVGFVLVPFGIGFAVWKVWPQQ